MHKFTYKKLRDDFTLLVTAARNAQRIPVAKTKKRRVIFDRYIAGRSRRYDRANFVGGCKPLVDALRSCQLLVDDSERWLDDYYRQYSVVLNTRIEITIQELDYA